MIYNFRQGIASYPRDGNVQQFLAKSGNYVTLTVSPGSLVQVIFADHDVDYLLDESITVANAWGPIPSNTEAWIYWSIHTLTGTREFGFTTLEPVSGPQPPPSPLQDQHWFDTVNTTMFVFNGRKWVKCIRVFAAKVLNNTFTPLGHELLIAPFAGSQVGLYGPTYQTQASYILYDSHGKPIPKQTGEFLRVCDEFLIQGSHITHINLESYVVRLMADEPIARYYVGKVVGENHTILATYDDIQDGLLAVSVEDLTLYAVGAFVIQGVITNINWDWVEPPGTPLWIRESGNFVTLDPHVEDAIRWPTAKPPVARVLNKTSIVFNQGMGGKGERGLPGTGSGSTGSVDLASTSIAGITKLSVTPTDSNNPVAVGTNDPRMSDARPPLPHAHEIFDVSGLQEQLDAKLPITGGSLTGPLLLSGSPTTDLQAATKQYVDAAIANIPESGNSAGVSLDVHQIGHGFTVGDAVYFTGAVWAKARSDSPNTLAIAIVSTITGPNDFVCQQAGEIKGLSGLTPGQYYFVSDVTSGQLTSTEPLSYSNPILFALSPTSGIVLPFRPSEVGAEMPSGVYIGNTFVDFTRDPGTLNISGLNLTDGGASRLLEPRTINGVPFDGTTNITIPSSGGSSANDTVTIEAGEDLISGTPVYVMNNKVYAATYITTPSVIGITSEQGFTGFPVTVVMSGTVTLSGLVSGTPYYVGAYTITPTVPTSKYLIKIGTALNDTTLAVRIETAIYLN